MTSRDDLVHNKRHNYRLWQSGAYGNRLRSWRTIGDWLSSGHSGLVTLRVLLGPGGRGTCHYDVGDPAEVAEVMGRWISRGISRDLITIDESAPKREVVLQGEYLNDVYSDASGEVRWGHLHHSRLSGLHMRDALAWASEEASGLRADLLLRHHMTPASHDDWLGLVERFPGHVLEVSIYDRCLGDLPGRNALVWEVRRY
jgi:hypothetical protein